ncbi:MAG: ribonuclease III [Parcubacteria group bacterium CG11_big_fil_rev_8_21_14_0_20_39_22]|nr:MAG: ribonuclease III [Parcubacteria group bacterium CG11_big_fil_rev_8_21_14_0_20_39_22]
MDLEEFESKIDIEFKNKDLLKRAFTHRSYLNEHRNLKMEHNERLEFLGDAVLELIITSYLYTKYPDKQEGELTSYRAALVRTETLAGIAEELSLNDFLLLSRGEAKDTGRARQYILANTVEAVIGAIYLDQGYDGAEKFIGSVLFEKTEKVISERTWLDAKSHFQEKAQEFTSITPSYKVMEESGPDHDKKFVAGVFIGEEKIADGEGKSKQEAEQQAAAEGLKVKGWE